MKKITLFILLYLSIAMVKAQYPQTLPITHTSFFATGAMGADPTLEKGTYSASGDAILANQWSRSSGTTGGSSPTVENSTLSYANYIDNNAGKAIILADGNSNRRSIYSLTNSNQYRDAYFYLGFLVRVSSITTTGYLISWDANHTSTTIRGAVFVRADTDGFNIGMSAVNNTTNVLRWSSKLNFNETYFMVLKVNPVSTGVTNYAFFVNPTIGNTEAQSTALADTTVASGGLAQIRGITIQQATGVNARLAGLRFSNSWNDVVKAAAAAAPKLDTPSVGTASSVTSSGFTANWTAVANAISYDVQVYQGASLLKTTNFSGQSTSSGSITGLFAVTPYTYKVVAKGDGVNYSDSDPSSASADITTTVFTENFATATLDQPLEGYNFWAMSTNTSWQAGASPLIGATPLVYPGYPGSNTGHVAVISKDNTARSSVKLTSLAPLADGTAVYASLLVKIDDASASGLREFFALNQSMAEFTRARVSAEHFPDDNTVKFAVGKASAKSNPSAAFSDADTHLLVFKYDKIAGSNNDKLSLYINPDLTLSESEQANAIVDYEDATQTDWTANPPHLLIRQTGIGAKLGSFRVGNTWEQVIPAPNVPLLAAPTVGVASSIISTGFTANWTPVANATGYKVFVYQGSTVVSTKTVSGQATESVSITGLTSDKTYTYKVLALGDGYQNYADSYLSGASAEFIISFTSATESASTLKLTVSGKSIRASEVGNFEIYSLQGAKVYQRKNADVAETELHKGIYILQFTHENGKQTTQKIILN
jgi:hypothetical protein